MGEPVTCLCGQLGIMEKGDNPDPCPKCGRKFIFNFDYKGEIYVLKFPSKEDEPNVCIY